MAPQLAVLAPFPPVSNPLAGGHRQTFDLNSDKEILAGEHTQNVGRTPAKPAFTGEKQFAGGCGFRCLQEQLFSTASVLLVQRYSFNKPLYTVLQ